MVNAAKHSGAASVQVFAEVEPESISVFVRDRGRGFDSNGIAADRAGVRESIEGRMKRAGGTALVKSREGDGTEVALTLPKAES
jgi:signal transduction histidine kinase